MDREVEIALRAVEEAETTFGAPPVTVKD